MEDRNWQNVETAEKCTGAVRRRNKFAREDQVCTESGNSMIEESSSTIRCLDPAQRFNFHPAAGVVYSYVDTTTRRGNKLTYVIMKMEKTMGR